MYRVGLHRKKWSVVVVAANSYRTPDRKNGGRVKIPVILLSQQC